MTITGGSSASPTAVWTGCTEDATDNKKCKYDYTGNANYCPSNSVYASITDACGNDTSATYTVAKTTSFSVTAAP